MSTFVQPMLKDGRMQTEKHLISLQLRCNLYFHFPTSRENFVGTEPFYKKSYPKCWLGYLTNLPNAFVDLYIWIFFGFAGSFWVFFSKNV